MNIKEARKIIETGEWEGKGKGLCGELMAQSYIECYEKAKRLADGVRTADKTEALIALGQWDKES